MKADEWKHWVLIYSIYCLRGILPDRDLNIWTLFVNACHLICRPIIRLTDVTQGHNLLKLFYDQFQKHYGRTYLVPNMHMMLHMNECIEEYGPVHGFWCFGFESYCLNNYVKYNVFLFTMSWKHFLYSSVRTLKSYFVFPFCVTSTY